MNFHYLLTKCDSTKLLGIESLDMYLNSLEKKL